MTERKTKFTSLQVMKENGALEVQQVRVQTLSQPKGRVHVNRVRLASTIKCEGFLPQCALRVSYLTVSFWCLHFKSHLVNVYREFVSYFVKIERKIQMHCVAEMLQQMAPGNYLRSLKCFYLKTDIKTWRIVFSHHYKSWR
jgi:hypothetical protein